MYTWDVVNSNVDVSNSVVVLSGSDVKQSSFPLALCDKFLEFIKMPLVDCWSPEPCMLLLVAMVTALYKIPSLTSLILGHWLISKVVSCCFV